MELYVICTLTQDGRTVHAADTIPEQAEEKARAWAQQLARVHGGKARLYRYSNPLSAGPNLAQAYHVRTGAGGWWANVEIFTVWE